MKRWLLLALLPLCAGRAVALCTSITSTTLAFGTYTGAAAVAYTATVTANCTAGFAYVIGVGGGDSGNTAARVMNAYAVATNMSYQMYKDAAHTMIWGDNNGVDTVSATGTGANQTFTIYGLIPAGQNLIPGSYQDYPIVYVQSGPFATFSPTATVPANCTISAGNLPFGTYANATLYGSAALSVNCTQTTTWNVGLNAGTATGATVTTRAMTGPGASTLAYSLFQSNAYTQNWGMTVGTDTVAGTGTGNAQAETVYGRISAGLLVRPGSYTDTITVTISY